MSIQILQVEAVIHSDANPVVSLDHADWKVKDIRVAHYDTKYPCCPETYQTVSRLLLMVAKVFNKVVHLLLVNVVIMDFKA